jgi:hypothetical protein
MLCSLNFFSRNFVEVGAFGKELPDQSVGILVVFYSGGYMSGMIYGKRKSSLHRIKENKIRIY